MSLYRRAAKRDANEAAICEALEAQGFSVTRVSGRGVPDLIVSKRTGGDVPALNFLRLVEIKNPKGKNKATPDQVLFQQRYQGPPIITLRSVEDALRFMLLAYETGGR